MKYLPKQKGHQIPLAGSPFEGWRVIKMPKVTWLEMETRVEEAFGVAYKHAIKLVRKHRRKVDIIKALRREIP